MAFESRFGAAAEAYSSYRREYPRELFDRILAHVPSGRRRRTLADPESYWRGLECRFCDAWPHAKIPVDMSRWLILMRKL
jgi:hypothetical protein